MQRLGRDLLGERGRPLGGPAVVGVEERLVLQPYCPFGRQPDSEPGGFAVHRSLHPVGEDVTMNGVAAWVTPCQQTCDQDEFELVVLLGQFLVPVVDLLVQLPQGPLGALSLGPASPPRQPRSVGPQHLGRVFAADAVVVGLLPPLATVLGPHQLLPRSLARERRILTVRVPAQFRGHPPVQHFRQGRRGGLGHVVEGEQDAVGPVDGAPYGGRQTGEP